MICIFNTHGQDISLNHRTGQICKIIKAIPPRKYDFLDVGFMYEIQFEDELITNALSNELTKINF